MPRPDQGHKHTGAHAYLNHNLLAYPINTDPLVDRQCEVDLHCKTGRVEEVNPLATSQRRAGHRFEATRQLPPKGLT